MAKGISDEDAGLDVSVGFAIEDLPRRDRPPGQGSSTNDICIGLGVEIRRLYFIVSLKVDAI